MFTGIITDVATVVSSEPSPAGRRMVIASAYDPDGIDIGASICCSGACMTVVEKGRDAAGRGWFAIDVSPEEDMAFCQRLTADHGVAAIPLSAFYPDSPWHGGVRFCFAKADAVLDAGLARLPPA